MKLIKFENGNKVVGYTFGDLSSQARQFALEEEWQFLLETKCEEDLEDIDVDYLQEIIEMNNYLYDVDGKLLPIRHYLDKNIMTWVYNYQTNREEQIVIEDMISE